MASPYYQAQDSAAESGYESQPYSPVTPTPHNEHDDYVIHKDPANNNPPHSEGAGVLAYAEQLVEGGQHRLAQVREWLMQTLFTVQNNRLSIALVGLNFLALFCHFALHLEKPYQAEAVASQFLFNVVLLGVPALLYPGVFFAVFSSYLLYKYLKGPREQQTVFFF